MKSNWGNLRNKTVNVYLASIADKHLEDIFDYNFMDSKRFYECVAWYRLVIFYLNELAGLKGNITKINETKLLQMDMGEIGSLSFRLNEYPNMSVALIEDFNFNPYKSLMIEKKKTIDDIITEVLAEYINRRQSVLT